MPDTLAVTEEEALSLLAYLTASADISLVEPELYGPFRLIDASSQLAGYVVGHQPQKRQVFWQAIKEEIDQKKVWLMWDRPGFRTFLQAMPSRVAVELAKIDESDQTAQTDKPGALTEYEALKLLAYLTASADISLFEPDLYGPFRLIDAASQLAGYVLDHRPAKRQTFWHAIKTEIDQKRVWLMWDRPGFRTFLAEMPAKVTKELT
ncbi:MAG: DUF6092 family protein [Chloroflexota bacterium]